jgi:hypothetical protein
MGAQQSSTEAQPVVSPKAPPPLKSPSAAAADETFSVQPVAAIPVPCKQEPATGYPSIPMVDPTPTGVPRIDSDDMHDLMPKIQAVTARKASLTSNPQPTAVPAPQRQYFGVLGQRHVICINGLPNNGKAFVARELGWYLEFFHGARVEYFEVDKYADHGSREANALALLRDVENFLRRAVRRERAGASAMTRDASPEGRAEDLRKASNTDSGRVAIVMPPRMATMAAMDDEGAKEVWNNTWSCINALECV